jgi:small conductance mechanosensitive channel
VFGVAYDDDLDKVEAVLKDVVLAYPTVLADPEPNIRVHELADSSVNFIVRPWVKTSDYWDTYWDLTKLVKQRFDAEGISIPFPQRDVHMFDPANETPA